ncbi:hypothetical protein EF908_28780 [Streptomyces sp. WAC04770]|nr:hypothetical protein [Streptomyces sp. WAC04770]RST20222.1 hypothetical protein EF908_28780 [Streptomyces sp. WAC04770]
MSSMRTAKNTIACSAVRGTRSTGGAGAPNPVSDDDMPWGTAAHPSYAGFPWGDIPWGDMPWG